MSPWEIGLVLLWFVVLALAALVVALLRHIGGLELHIEELARQRISQINRSGLSPGSPAPEIDLLDDSGAEVRFSPPDGQRSVVVLSQPGCTPCPQLLPDLGRLAAEPGAPAVVVITKGPPGSTVAPPGVRALYQRHAEAMAKFQALATPWAFVVGPDGVIEAQGAVSNRAGLHRVLDTSRQQSPRQSA